MNLVHHVCWRSASIAKLGGAPVLFNKFQLTVILWVIITDAAAALDQLTQCQLLLDKVGLVGEEPPAVAVHVILRALEALVLCVEFVRSWLESVFVNDPFHALEMVGKGGMVMREVEWLVDASSHAVRVLEANAHPGPVLVPRPPQVRILRQIPHQKCIARALLLARCVIEPGETGRAPLGLAPRCCP
jgi:hypothetical protein